MIIKFLRQLSVRSRIIGAFVVLLVILAVSIPLIVVNHLALTKRVQQLANVESKSDRLLLLSLSRVLSSRVNLMRYADDLTPSSSEALKDINQAVEHIEEARTLITKTEQKTAMAKILSGMVSYSTLIADTQTARDENRLEDVPNLLSNSYQLEFDLEQQIRAVVGENEARVDAVNKAALADAQQRLNLLVTIYTVLLLLAILIAFVVQKSITSPISELRVGIEEFRLTGKETSIPSVGQDELSLLAKAFNQITAELAQTLSRLEQRVTDRTKALETVAEISTVTSTILESDKLLQEVVDLSKERFNLYHSHIYLLDEAGENLVLAAGAGEPGKQMVAEGRSIPLNREQSLVARAAREQKGVTVNDVTLERDFLPNPLLPETRSELAVPMIVGEKVIGVFDVQSDVIGRFTDADIAVQATLASQVASAVQNARLYTSAEQALRVAKDLVDYATEGLAILDLETELWAEPNENFANTFGMSREELAKTGPKQMSPPKQPDGRDSVEKAIEMINIAMKKGSHSFEWVHTTAQGNNFTCEIRLVRMPGAHPRLRQSITDITERRRTEELIKRQAQQQEALNRITQKIQSTTNIGAALQIAARELGHALGMKSTLVTLEPETPRMTDSHNLQNENEPLETGVSQ